MFYIPKTCLPSSGVALFKYIRNKLIRSFVYLYLAAIKTHSPEKPVLVFVSSRRQTRLTALDLIAFLAGEDNPKQWLHMPEMEVCLVLMI